MRGRVDAEPGVRINPTSSESAPLGGQKPMVMLSQKRVRGALTPADKATKAGPPCFNCVRCARGDSDPNAQRAPLHGGNKS